MTIIEHCKKCTGVTDKTCICSKCIYISIGKHYLNEYHCSCGVDMYNRKCKRKDRRTEGFITCNKYENDWIKELKHGR